MKLLDRYIGITVLQSVVAVMAVLLGLFVFITFAGELERVGRGSYELMDAIVYSLLLTPTLIYQLFPMVLLIGCIMGMGAMAGNSELVVIRAAGVSLMRIIGSVIKTGLPLILLVVFVGEFIAPKTEFQAQSLRAEAIDNKVRLSKDSSLWARDGDAYVHIKDLLAEDEVRRITLFYFGDNNEMTRMVTAASGHYQYGGWLLKDVVNTTVSDQGLITESLDTLVWDSMLEPKLISVVTVQPDFLSMMGLMKYIDYFQSNGLDSGRYQLAFWRKIIAPVVMLIMIAIAVPFVFGPLRSVGVGQRIFIGTLMGIVFYMTDQVVGQMTLLYGIPPVLGVLVAPTIFMLIALYLIKQVR